MTKIYNKLVRDKIPDIITSDGRKCETEILSEVDYKQALRDKITEEGEEVRSASDGDLLTEIADLYEVIDALIMAYGLSKEDIIRRQDERRKSRGGFVKRIKLISTSD
jgi:predicted house-cleaning noncanonical NTP pyrophosphatase (MazG superfamily)